MGHSQASDIPYAIVVERTFIHRVYAWMTGGLAITALVALLVAAQGWALPLVRSGVYLFLIIGELVLVLALVAAIQRMTPAVAGMCFVLYAALNGLTLSVIFLAYAHSSIASAFFVTAGTFGAMTVYGSVTKRDLTSIGNLCFMALFGLILAMIVNLFVGSSRLDLLISVVGVLVFVGLTAYDTQKVKQMHAAGQDGSAADRKAAVMGALALYLDFINLFLFILRLMGRGRD